MLWGSTSRRLRVALAGLAALLLAATVPGGAAAQEPYDDWNAQLPGFPSNTPDAPRANCAGGEDACIDRTLGEMWRRFHTVVPRCDHNAIFSLTYLRVTQDVREGIGIGFWPDRNWINRQDALFARTYFLSYENFLAGRLDLVPEAWRIAYGAGANQEVQGIGNLLLSMNAHINRDFPFVIYRSGVVRPDGTSRKPEHDAYNSRLRELYKPMLAELARRFDPTIDDYDVPGVVADDDTFFQILIQWREDAWDYAVQLANAANDAERREVAAEIEANAANWANLIYNGARYGPGQGPEQRNAVCAENGGQRPDYRRGTDVAGAAGRVAKTTKAGLEVKLRCPNGMGPCVGNVKARRPRLEAGGLRELGKAPFFIEAGKAETVSIRLSDAARDELGRGGGKRGVWLGIRSKLGPGDAVTKRPKLRLLR